MVTQQEEPYRESQRLNCSVYSQSIQQSLHQEENLYLQWLWVCFHSHISAEHLWIHPCAAGITCCALLDTLLWCPLYHNPEPPACIIFAFILILFFVFFPLVSHFSLPQFPCRMAWWKDLLQHVGYRATWQEMCEGLACAMGELVI